MPKELSQHREKPAGPHSSQNYFRQPGHKVRLDVHLHEENVVYYLLELCLAGRNKIMLLA